MHYFRSIHQINPLKTIMVSTKILSTMVFNFEYIKRCFLISAC